MITNFFRLVLICVIVVSFITSSNVVYSQQSPVEIHEEILYNNKTDGGEVRVRVYLINDGTSSVTLSYEYKDSIITIYGSDDDGKGINSFRHSIGRNAIETDLLIVSTHIFYKGDKSRSKFASSHNLKIPAIQAGQVGFKKGNKFTNLSDKNVEKAFTFFNHLVEICRNGHEDFKVELDQIVEVLLFIVNYYPAEWKEV